MKTDVVRDGDSLILRPEIDTLDAYAAVDFKAEVNALVGNASGHVILDMKSINFVDSAGLGAILSVMRLVRGRDKHFVICNMTPPVRSLFELVRIHKVLDICNSRDEALHLVSAC